MKVETSSQTKFKGYDARPLKGFIMNSNSYGIAREMQAIGEKEGFKIFTPIEDFFEISCKEGISKYIEDTKGVWAQDLWTIAKNKLLAFEITEKSYAIKEFFNLKFDFTQKTVRENPNFLTLNEKVWKLADKIATTKNAFKQAMLIISFEKYRNQLKNFQHTFHIPGGNIYIVKGNNGDEAFVGEKELNKYSIDEIKTMYGVNKVIPLPQMDYHIDLFIRPLDNKKVLVADDNLNIQILEKQAKKLNQLILKKKTLEEKKQYKDIFVKLNSTLSTMKTIMRSNPLPTTDEIVTILEKNGYEALRVPARVYEIVEFVNSKNIVPKHLCNYLNANVLKKENGDLVYITNKSNIDSLLGLTPELIKELGYSYEQDFINRLSPYVKMEHIYFIKGEKDFVATQMLSEYQGGIHCACSEIPIEEEM